MEVTKSSSWILKGIMKTSHIILRVQRYWNHSLREGKFRMGVVYKDIQNQEPNVNWYAILAGNKARPRAIFCLWIACHLKLATKKRLANWGMISYKTRCFCQASENIDHLLFECDVMQEIWSSFLQWLQVSHKPSQWEEKINWISNYCRGKGKRVGVMKIVIVETVYHCWNYMNNTCFNRNQNIDKIEVVNNIIEFIIQRGSYNRKYRKYIALLMM
ncbi:unnamed protein product [Lathyrus sativus]|nr:unnamed protein product [Lathyrus sativus]